MPAYNYKERFAPKVINRSKPHTIRADRKNQPRAGQMAYHYTGLRTKKTRFLAKAILTKVLEIKITTIAFNDDPVPGLVSVEIAGKVLSTTQERLLAIKDGFNDRQEFTDFFHNSAKIAQIGSNRRIFTGTISFWNPKKLSFTR